MNLFGRLFGQKEKPQSFELKSAMYFDPYSFLGAAILGQPLSSRQAFDFYRQSSAVATAVDMIADEVEQIRPVIEGPDGKLIDEHPVLDLLKKPNYVETYRAFMGKLARHWLLTHEKYEYLQGNINRLPINIWAVSPEAISRTESENDGYPISFQVSTGPGAGIYNRREDLVKRTWRYTENELRELVRTAGFSSETTDTISDSPLQAAANDVNQQIKGKIHNVKLLENGARPSLVVNFKDPLDPRQHEQRKEAIQAQLGGAANAGKIAVVSSTDMELKDIGSTSNKDMDYANLERISSTAIFLRYKIPLPLISTDASTYNNMEQAKFDLYDRAVLPCANVIFEGLSHALLPRAGLDPSKFKITYDAEAIPALRGRMLAELKVRRDLNLESINELRAQLPGREPIEGGNTVYQPATLVPIGTDLLTGDNSSEMDDSGGEMEDEENGDS